MLRLRGEAIRISRNSKRWHLLRGPSANRVTTSSVSTGRQAAGFSRDRDQRQVHCRHENSWGCWDVCASSVIKRDPNFTHSVATKNYNSEPRKWQYGVGP